MIDAARQDLRINPACSNMLGVVISTLVEKEAKSVDLPAGRSEVAIAKYIAKQSKTRKKALIDSEL
jgi:hypothetical protein